MSHLPALIQDLALILVSGALATVLFRAIKQPVVLGYIVAGLLVGPNTRIYPTITDLPNVQIWAEIGVIFLLFALGLEFSFKKVAKVGAAAGITAFLEVAGMTALGFGAGRLFGWSKMDALFLGGILAISSTTIIIRAFTEAGVRGRAFVNLVFGILIVEDLFAILLLVMLSTVAVHRSFDGWTFVQAIAKLAFFVVFWFVSGVFLLPSVLRQARRFLDEETLLLVSVGLCFLMVVLTTKAGFSPALGAFMMGSILSETDDSERIQRLIHPVKDLFAAIFFVSVGMLIDPQALVTYAGPILWLTLLTIVGKFMTTAIGALIAGRNLREAVQSGMSLAQIGEFSFIIATLGLSLGVTSDSLYPIAVGVSAITTFTTPYLIRFSDGAYARLERALPRKLVKDLDDYRNSAQVLGERAEWRRVLRSYGLTLLVNSALITAIFFGLARALPGAVGLSLAATLAAPFFWAMLVRRLRSLDVRQLWRRRENRPAIVVLESLRLLSAIALFGFLSPQFIALRFAAALTMIFTFVFLLLFSRYLKSVYSWFEGRFMQNLSSPEPEAHRLAPWDAHISRVEVPLYSAVAGRNLVELNLREEVGVIVALIERAGHLIPAPSAAEKLLPGDHVSVIGDDRQVTRFTELIQPQTFEPHAAAHGFDLHQFLIEPDTPCAGQTIRQSGIREASQALVVGIERINERILNPEPNVTIRPGDLLWIVGDGRRLRKHFEAV